MAALSNVPFKDLERRGFVVIRSFLSPDEIAAYSADFSSQQFGDNLNYRLKEASQAANDRLSVRVKEVLAEVNAQTNLRVDAPQGASYFSTGKNAAVNFSWHQDHESFYEVQNHYDYLNFYIPIVKPRPDKSNLSIVPFDTLQKHSPKAFKVLVRGGATRFPRFLNTFLAIFDDSGKIIRLSVNIDELAETPHLSAGDLLLLRGDMIHRTQDTETERVAISFRATNLQAKVARRRLARGGLQKALMMANNPVKYEQMFSAFDRAGRNEMTVVEMREAMNGAPPVSHSGGRREFLKFLLQQKLRTHVLSSFVVSVASIYSLELFGRAARFYYRHVGAKA